MENSVKSESKRDFSSAEELLRVSNLTVSYPIAGGLFGGSKKLFNAVDGVSFSIRRGEILGLVGESGSGKTTTGRAIIKLAPISGGKIFYRGENISDLDEKRFLPYRKKIQMIFQDPFAKSPNGYFPNNFRAAGYTFQEDGPPEKARQGGGAFGNRWIESRLYGALSARILRRPAPAHRNCPRPGGRA